MFIADIFYPAVFGIQNDEDSRILEILFWYS